MVPAKRPAKTSNLQEISLYGFGALPIEDTTPVSEPPLKRRLRPRPSTALTEPETEVIVVKSFARQPKKGSSKPIKAAKKTATGKQRTPKEADPKSNTTEISDSEASS